VALLDAGGEVNDLDRGLVDYFAGQYDVAIQRFDIYIAANPTNDGTASYYRARANRDLIYDAACKIIRHSSRTTNHRAGEKPG
jgi:hypothetical protein